MDLEASQAQKTREREPDATVSTYDSPSGRWRSSNRTFAGRFGGHSERACCRCNCRVGIPERLRAHDYVLDRCARCDWFVGAGFIARQAGGPSRTIFLLALQADPQPLSISACAL